MKRAALAFALCLALPAFAQPTVKANAGDDLRALQATPQDVAEGRKLAQDSCGKCHGLNGVSPGAGVPNIAGQRAVYLHSQLKAYKGSGARAQTPMAGVVKFLSDEALVKVASYYASLEPARPAPAPRAAAPSDPLATAKSAVQACAGCHGDNGVSAMAGTPNLTAHDPKYFVAALQAYKSGKRKHDMMKGMVSTLPDFDSVALYYALQKPAKSANAAKGDAAAGKAAASACAGCHGENGVSATATTPSLAGQDPEYLAAATKAYKDGTRADETMKGIAGTLDDKAMRDVAAYFASLTPQAVNVRKPLTTAEWVERCDRCHGVNGNSTDPAVPALAAQRADWLETVLGNYRSGARKSTAMSAMTSSLGDGDIKDIAAYYSRQPARPVTYIILVPAK
jgi:cytochrome c553